MVRLSIQQFLQTLEDNPGIRNRVYETEEGKHMEYLHKTLGRDCSYFRAMVTTVFPMNCPDLYSDVCSAFLHSQEVSDDRA